MKTLKLNGLLIEYFDGDTDQMLTDQYNRFMRELQIQSAIGSDLEQFDLKLAKLQVYAQKGMHQEHRVEIDQIRQLLYFVKNNISPEEKAFIYIIKSIDGEPVTDYGDDNVDLIRTRLSRAGFTIRMLRKILDQVKKKAEDELMLMFPEMVTSSKQSEYLYRVQERSRIILRAIIDRLPVAQIDSVIDEIDTALLKFHRPLNFGGPQGVEVKMRKAYEETVAILSRNVSKDPKLMTVTEYYTNLKLIKEQQKQNQKRNQNGR